MANEEKKEAIRQARMATDSTVRELQETVEALPRTDHMTLPAVQITEIDPQTLARINTILEINKAEDGDTVVDETGKTLSQVRNEFAFGVTNLEDRGGKHEILVSEADENGVQSVTIVPPKIKVMDKEGKEKELQDSELVIEATPANIAPVDVDAPHNPVEAREAAGLAADGSEGDASTAVPVVAARPEATSTTPVAEPVSKPLDFGTKEKVGGTEVDAPLKNNTEK